MRRRLYFLLPDVESAQRVADELLLARVENGHMHFLARRGMDLGNLHEAGYLIKSDLLHGAGVGLGLGVLGGLLIGGALVLHPFEGLPTHPGVPFVAVFIGGVLGAWTASMAGASVPNSRLRRFERDIAEGKVLLMVDVPFRSVERIRAAVASRHPEAVPAGQVRPYLVFP